MLPLETKVQLKEFLLDHIKNEQSNWKVQPEIITGDQLQDCIVLNLAIQRPPFLPIWTL